MYTGYKLKGKDQDEEGRDASRGALGLDQWTAGLACHKAKDRSVESEWSMPMHSPGFSALQRAWQEVCSEWE